MLVCRNSNLSDFSLLYLTYYLCTLLKIMIYLLLDPKLFSYYLPCSYDYETPNKLQIRNQELTSNFNE